MLYIRFLNLQNPLQDVEQLYKDGTIEQGDIVCQQYTDKYSRLFMNGTWVKTKYISKIAQNTEVEDDVKTLYDSIVNTSTMLNDTSIRLNNVSTRLNNLYTNTQIDTFISNLNTSIKDTSDNLNIVSGKVNEVSTRLNDTSIRLNDVSTRLNDTSVRLLNYLTINQYLKDEELIASTFADLNNKINNVGNIDFSNYYTTEVIDNKIKDINTSINNVSNNVKTVSDKLTEVSTRLDNSSTRLNNVSINIDNVSSRLNDTSVRLLNYLTINQYLKDEELIASTFADVNNKINSLYAEIAELKEQLKSSTK